MNANLVQQAVLGSPDAWPLLLSVGAERVAAAAKYQPGKTELTKDDFCEKDAQEILSEREALAAIKPGEILRGYRYDPYVVKLSRLNKRFPDNLVPRFLRIFKEDSELSGKGRDAVASLCGNVWRWFSQFSAFRKEADIDVLDNLNTQQLTPEQAKERALRDLKSEAPYRRFSALLGLREYNPDEARELLAKATPKELNDDKGLLVRALARGLSANDEPFLEEIVASGGDDARAEAFRLLCEIPTSPRSIALRERAEAVLRGEVPEYDAECKIAQFSEDEYLFPIDIIRLVPIKYWTETHNLSPKELGQKYPCSRENEAVYIGWLYASYHTPEDELDDEWTSVFLDFWKYLIDLPEFSRSEIKKGRRYDAIENAFRLLVGFLYRRGGMEAALQMDNTEPGEKTIKYYTNFGREGYFTENYEPKPWSEEYMSAYFQCVVENRMPSREHVIVYDLGSFSREWREKIVQLSKEDPRLQKKRYQYAPDTAEKLFAAIEDFVACFGEIRG